METQSAGNDWKDRRTPPRKNRRLRALFARGAEEALCGLTGLFTGASARWVGVEPIAGPRIYYANHTSMADLLLIWGALPRRLRRICQPVAGSDFWLASQTRAFIAREVFNAVLIDRNRDTQTDDPVLKMKQSVDRGTQLILFPEGTRNTSRHRLLPFRTGIYHLAATCPGVDLVPVWVANSRRVLSKGRLIPVPYLCTVTFGRSIRLLEKESTHDFLTRARRHLVELSQSPEVKS